MNGSHFGTLKTPDQVAHSPLRSKALELHKKLDGEVSDAVKNEVEAFLDAVKDVAEASPSQKFISASVRNVYRNTWQRSCHVPVLRVGLEALVNLNVDLNVGLAAKLLAGCRLPEISCRRSGPVYRECLQELPAYTQNETEKHLASIALKVADQFSGPVPQALFLSPAIDLLGKNVTEEPLATVRAAYGFSASYWAERKYRRDFGDAYPNGLVAAKKVGELVMETMQEDLSTDTSDEAVVRAQRKRFTEVLHRNPALVDHLRAQGLPGLDSPK
ncbi:hypothetical protein [Candidatus Entotheonella palauensis]|uniref:Uncharacterized protein n=1 Tax=Candidatus Entotheonella gemina TaxID=1429439 RepID=W4M434_9BACT|nr:hypothetical protein [Candidatus Entotheonella palauensis]ETX04933.1 MAG: hypothetical protein ETSY2_25985 [Candidatus Entotheonella gemina]